MTASSVDTAELPRVSPPVAREPIAVVAAPAPQVQRVPDRLELRAERRQERRRRRLYALLGIGVLVVALFAAVAVVDMVR